LGPHGWLFYKFVKLLFLHKEQIARMQFEAGCAPGELRLDAIIDLLIENIIVNNVSN
jgi:hypothetical protein